MRKVIAALFGLALSIMLYANGASAQVPDGGYGDGKVPSVKVQKAACKPVADEIGKRSATYKECRTLAKLPTWWIHIDGTNYSVNDGPTLIGLTVKTMPVCEWDAEFAYHIKRFKDNHASITV